MTITTPAPVSEPVPAIASLDDIADLLPKAAAYAALRGSIPSQNSLMRDLQVGIPKARALRSWLIERDAAAPRSPGAPGSNYDTGSYPLVAPRPATMTRPLPERSSDHRKRNQVALVVPLLLVNSAAVYGQAGWAYDHLGRGIIVAILFAAAVESIGIYLAAEAHSALMAGDASARLRLSSYLVGLLVGALNYAHFAGPHYEVTPVALTFGLLSSISPWLWSIRSRSMNRDRLRELGQVDPRAVKFSLLRWALFPARTAAAFRAAVWAGVVTPAEAVAAADSTREARLVARAARRTARSQRNTKNSDSAIAPPAAEPTNASA